MAIAAWRGGVVAAEVDEPVDRRPGVVQPPRHHQRGGRDRVAEPAHLDARRAELQRPVLVQHGDADPVGHLAQDVLGVRLLQGDPLGLVAPDLPPDLVVVGGALHPGPVHQRQAGHVVEGQPVALGQRVAVRQHHDQLFLGDGQVSDTPQEGPRADEGDVHLFRLEQFQVTPGLRGGQGQPDRGVAGTEALHQLVHRQVGAGAAVGHPQDPGGLLGGGAHRLGAPPSLGEHYLTMLAQHLPRWGEGNAPGAPVDQRRAQLAFEHPDLLRQAGLGNM